jgi:protein phosphatase
MRKLTWQVAGITDRGLVRADNQDNYYISSDERVFVVADGMGGTKGGATASKIAVETVKQMWDEQRPDTKDKEAVQNWLQEAVTKANNNICDEADGSVGCKGMGTTIVVAVQPEEGEEIHIAHVGDSRAYVLKEGTIEPVTNDHSVVMEMMRKDRLTPEQCRTNPFRHLLTRCLGHERDVEVDKTNVGLADPAWMVLCSDGLSSVVPDEEIGSTIIACDSAGEVCQKLLTKTIDAGAPDNVTIVVVKYGFDEGQDGDTSEPLAAEKRASSRATSGD